MQPRLRLFFLLFFFFCIFFSLVPTAALRAAFCFGRVTPRCPACASGRPIYVYIFIHTHAYPTVTYLRAEPRRDPVTRILAAGRCLVSVPRVNGYAFTLHSTEGQARRWIRRYVPAPRTRARFLSTAPVSASPLSTSLRSLLLGNERTLAWYFFFRFSFCTVSFGHGTWKLASARIVSCFRFPLSWEKSTRKGLIHVV